MSINTILGILSSIAFLLPVAIILLSRYFLNLSLLALVVYFLLVLTYNLMTEGILPVRTSFRLHWGTITNYLDVPLMLTAMLLFCSNHQWKQKLLMGTGALFLIYEVIIFAVFQLQPVSTKYIMGPGIIIVAGFAFHFFVVGIKSTIEFGKGLGKTLMAASITFAYGCYLLLYYFAYIQKTSNKADVYIIYYIASTIFAIVMSLGLLWLKKRMKAIEELQTTRRELNMFFYN